MIRRFTPRSIVGLSSNPDVSAENPRAEIFRMQADTCADKPVMVRARIREIPFFAPRRRMFMQAIAVSDGVFFIRGR